MERKAWARAWRPQFFRDVCGHQEVIKAFQVALATGRLHHAYLLTGTRGVGKTTLARIFAKALNCEQGVVDEPCNQCEHCEAITKGDFVDVLEIDAASRTRVEETRELLENVPFRPVSGRFKVYIIDEVHMLSMHSFNALLKTLEEPPPHAKFILATTDPQKLPATIVSRCLRFHLRSLSQSEISLQLTKILQQENISYDPEALMMVAEAGQGSLRDALSLLEQVVMIAGTPLKEDDVAKALGVVPSAMLLSFWRMLALGDFVSLPAWLQEVYEAGVNYKALLRRLVAIAYEVSLYQTTKVYKADFHLAEIDLKHLSSTISATDVQLFYEALLKGLDDLSKTPSEKIAFEMAILRGIFFIKAASLDEIKEVPRQVVSHPSVKKPKEKTIDFPVGANQHQAQEALPSKKEPAVLTEGSWRELAKSIPLQGIPKMVLLETCFGSLNGKNLILLMDKKSLPMVSAHVKQELQTKISAHLARDIQLEIQSATKALKTARVELEEEKANQKRQNQERFAKNPAVQETLEKLNGTLDLDSIREVER